MTAITALYGGTELEPLPWNSKVRFKVNADVEGKTVERYAASEEIFGYR